MRIKVKFHGLYLLKKGGQAARIATAHSIKVCEHSQVLMGKTQWRRRPSESETVGPSPLGFIKAMSLKGQKGGVKMNKFQNPSEFAEWKLRMQLVRGLLVLVVVGTAILEGIFWSPLWALGLITVGIVLYIVMMWRAIKVEDEYFRRR